MRCFVPVLRRLSVGEPTICYINSPVRLTASVNDENPLTYPHECYRVSPGPTSQPVPCRNCGASAFALIPAHSRIVDDEESADGKVWVNCNSCDERFLVYYRTDAEPTGED